MRRNNKYTLSDTYESVARSLREFGYSDVTAEMVRDTHEAMKAREKVMPHGIVGVLAQRRMDEVKDALDRLSI